MGFVAAIGVLQCIHEDFLDEARKSSFHFVIASIPISGYSLSRWQHPQRTLRLIFVPIPRLLRIFLIRGIPASQSRGYLAPIQAACRGIITDQTRPCTCPVTQVDSSIATPGRDGKLPSEIPLPSLHREMQPSKLFLLINFKSSSH